MLQAGLALSLPQAWNLSFSQRILVPFSRKCHLETKIWMLGVLVTIAFTSSRPSQWRELGYTYTRTYFYIHLYFKNNEVIPMPSIPVLFHRIHFSFLLLHLFILCLNSVINLFVIYLHIWWISLFISNLSFFLPPMWHSWNSDMHCTPPQATALLPAKTLSSPLVHLLQANIGPTPPTHKHTPHMDVYHVWLWLIVLD